MMLGSVMAMRTLGVVRGMWRWGARYLMEKESAVERRRSLRRIWVWGGMGGGFAVWFQLSMNWCGSERIGVYGGCDCSGDDGEFGSWV
jgi:hypothetical protein